MNVTTATTNPATTNPATTASTVTTKKNDSQLNYEQFMKLLVVQLQNQNPLEPMNDRDFYAQMAQLGQVQGMEKLQQSMDVTKAQSLMGKTVTATLSTNSDGTQQNVSGTVTRLTSKSDGYYVGLQTADGGFAEAKLDSIKTIEPTQDFTQLAGLIGKNAKGMLVTNGVPKEIAGEIVGIDTSTGTSNLRIKSSSGIVSVPLSNVTNIGG